MANDAAGIEIAQVSRVSALVGHLASLDLSGLSDGDLLMVLDAAARLRRLASTLQAGFAGEIARRSTPDRPGGGVARR